MATAPYFVLSPNTILSIAGLLRGPDKTIATPLEDWRQARVDLVIPALNEASHIALSLASVMKQTLRPRRIILVDDGSTDKTVEVAEAFCRLHGLELMAIRRRAPIGKTPTLKRQARELDSDVQFILDADTVLESDDYIARAVEELYKGAGIASVCGTILPLRKRDRQAWQNDERMRAFIDSFPGAPLRRDHWLRDASTAVTNVYREVLYSYLQRFVYRGQSVFFGTIGNPIGCAVAYRRIYVDELFRHFCPILGDDLTNSEDIFIGLAMLDKGYRNVHLTDVVARTVEPPVHRLPRQVYLWSSSFLQGCYYFNPLVTSPFKSIRRAIARWTERAPRRDAFAAVPAAAAMGTAGTLPVTFPGLWGSSGSQTPKSDKPSASDRRAQPEAAAANDGSRRVERRRLAEPYRQAFGRERTVEYGRPVGWMLMLSAVEKVFFPTTLLVLVLLQNWEGLMLTVAAETLISATVLAMVAKGNRLAMAVKSVVAAPVRYALMFSELYTISRFAVDLWVRKDRKWRK